MRALKLLARTGDRPLMAMDLWIVDNDAGRRLAEVDVIGETAPLWQGVQEGVTSKHRTWFVEPRPDRSPQHWCLGSPRKLNRISISLSTRPSARHHPFNRPNGITVVHSCLFSKLARLFSHHTRSFQVTWIGCRIREWSASCVFICMETTVS